MEHSRRETKNDRSIGYCVLMHCLHLVCCLLNCMGGRKLCQTEVGGIDRRAGRYKSRLAGITCIFLPIVLPSLHPLLADPFGTSNSLLGETFGDFSQESIDIRRVDFAVRERPGRGSSGIDVGVFPMDHKITQYCADRPSRRCTRGTKSKPSPIEAENGRIFGARITTSVSG